MFRRLLTAGFSVLALSALPACSASSQGPDGPGGPPLSMSENSPARPHEPRVLVFPFAPTGDVGTYAWIGHGIQESLQADLSRSGTAQVIFPASQPAPNTPVNPIDLARKSDANVVVVGSYQVAGSNVRITGTVYDVGTVRDLGGLKATGPATDIFKLEDQLNDQLTHVLPAGYTEAAAKPLPTVEYGTGSAAAAQANTVTSSSAAPGTAAAVDSPAVSAPTSPPDVTYNYISTPNDSLAYDSPYYYPGDYYAAGYPYFYDGPVIGFVGAYGGGFYGYRGYGYHGYGRPYFGGRTYLGSRGFGGRGDFGGGFHPGFSGGFHGGGGFGGGFHGGGGFGGGHR